MIWLCYINLQLYIITVIILRNSLDVFLNFPLIILMIMVNGYIESMLVFSVSAVRNFQNQSQLVP